MAYRLAIVGDPNTGKSYSRRFIPNGESVLIISPSQKATHLTQSDGKRLERLNVSIGASKDLDAITTKLGAKHKHEAIRMLLNNPPPEGTMVITGNNVICPDVRYVKDYMLFADKFMPHIKTIIQPDFTHFISNIISSPDFRSRTGGAEAFKRFWDMAADTLINILTSSDELREDIIVVTEYHMSFDETTEQYTIFVPAGKMLQGSFLPLSYYDYCVFTNVLPKEEEANEKERFKFVTVRKDRYNGRMGELFTSDEIPNNLHVVLEKMRDYLQIN